MSATSNRRHGRGLQAVFAVLLVGFALLAGAAPAAAHTALLETIPDNRAILEESPDELTIVFAEAVDPKSVRLEILTVEGESVDGVKRLTPDSPDSEVIVFALPPLPDGIYGLAWQTVGPDGHRVAGEVVLGIGVVDAAALESASFATTPTLDRILEIASVIARYVFYTGLALFAGAVWVLWWKRLRWSGDSEGGPLEALEQTAARLVRWGGAILLAGVIARLVSTIWSLARGYDNGSPYDDVAAALTSRTGFTGLLGIGVAVVLLLLAPRLARTRDPWMFGAAAAGGVALAVVSVVNGHTALLADSAIGIWVATVHIVGAAVWTGPVAVFALATFGTGWRNHTQVERRDASRAVFGDFAPWALIAFVLIVLSGIQSSILTVGGALFDSSYGSVLLVKLAVIVAVLVPLGLYHDAVAGWWGRRRRGSDGPARLAPSLRLEALAMGAVLILAAVLTSINPGSISGDASSGGAGQAARESPAADLLSTDAVEDVSECVSRTVGQVNCYRDFLAELMKEEGADVAVAEVYRLSQTDEYVARDCHQVAHDLGNDAAIHYGDLGVALSYEGSACWSGYYHGVVEYALGSLDNDQLLEELPTVCAAAAAEFYSFTHYNCVHGVGHGVMLRLEADLFASIPYCERLTDPWELSVCIGGLFMENIVSAQQGAVEPTLDTDDLIYPCNAVDVGYLDECFSMQTSWILWQLNYDFEAAFDLCDGVELEVVDDCYRSMGRDISGTSRLEVDRVVELCSLGDPAYQTECFVGASLNAVYNDHDVARATELCAAIPERMRAACREARDEAAATF